MAEKNKSTIHLKTIEDVMSDSFGRYAKYIIQDRALPDIRDGLKPVQRRIIYAMNELQLFHDRSHKKSARVIGEVIGKYHPHGDSSIYEAVVRMSQEWKNNIPLVNMHGNNGSIDGDSAAAMRYTECRLSLYGQSLINNIKKNTVKFIDNFDGSESEPTVLPSLLPNVLINGASGIAAGYATNIPPFNPTEVIDAIIARIDSPNCHLDTIMKIMPAPDFPTGGFLVGTENMRSIYETGKGKITIRAKFELVNNKQAYITEIPFETTKSSIIRNIEELANTHDFLNINEVRDESDKNGVSICIEFKNSKNFDTIKNFLFKNTQLQISYGVNMVVIKDRKPHLMSILFFLDSFIEHVDRIIVAELKFDLEKAKSRREIVIGLIKAIKILDDVISLIRKSSDKANAKENLMNKMSFTEQQAEAIVTLRLYRLSNSDIEELNKELNELNNIIVELELLFSDKEHRNNYIKNKLREYKKIFASKRRSVLSKEDANIVIDQTDTIENVNRIIVVTRDGYLKSMSNASFSTSKIEELKLKDGDIPLKIFVSNLRDKIILISSKGKYISIPTFKIEQTKWKEMGNHINNIISLENDEKIIAAFNYANNVEDERVLVLASAKGSIKRTFVKDLDISKLTKATVVMKLSSDDLLVSCDIIEKNDETDKLCVFTNEGNGIIYPINQVSIVGKNAAGVKNLSLKNNEKIVSVFSIKENSDKQFVALFCSQGAKRIKISEIYVGNRTNQAKSLIAQVKNNPYVVLNALLIDQSDYVSVIDSDEHWNIIKGSDIVIGNSDSRVSSLNKIKELKLSAFLSLPKKNNIFDE